MRKSFGSKTWLYPMPVLIVGTYDKDGNPNAMNAAWGGIYDTNKVMLCLSDDHKTTKNLIESGAFTINIANTANLVACDYVGIASGNNVQDKFVKAGFTATHGKYVNAPIIDQLPMCLECKLEKINEDGIVVGNIVDISADESVLGEDGLIDVAKLHAITYDSVHHYYVELGQKVGNAFSDGKKLK